MPSPMPERRWRARAAIVSFVALLGLLVSGLATASVAQVEEPLQSVTGTVSDSEGRPLAGAAVTLSGERVNQGYHELTTDQLGRFSVDLPAGSYTASFEMPGYAFEYLAGPEGPVVGNAPLVLDVTLLRLAVLEGRVTGPAGPVARAEVTAYRKLANGSWDSRGSSTSGPTGGYRITGLEPGTYRVRTVAAGLLPEYHPNAPELSAGGDVVITEDGNRLDVDLDGGTVRLGGRVTFQGEPLRHVPMVVDRVTSDQGWEYQQPTLFTDADGRWSVPAWPGEYRVRSPYSGPGAAGIDLVRRVVSTTDVLGADTNLRSGVIRGRVTGAGGPIPAVVELYGVGSHPKYPHPTVCLVVASAPVDGEGYYAAVGLTPMGYYVNARPVEEASGLYVPEAYPDAPVGCGGTGLTGSEPLPINLDLARVGGSPSPSPSVTPSQSPSPTESPTPSPTVSPSDSPSASPTASPTPVPDDGPRPLLLGFPRVGGVLAVLSWPRPGASVSRQWLRDGVPIDGATGILRRVVRADRGARLSVRLTYSRPDGSVSVSTSRTVRIR